MTTATASKTLHPFESQGLGKAPFRYLGVVTKVGPITIETRGGATVQVGAPGQPMGTCDYCGNGIKDCFRVIGSAEADQEFEVGCDCVRKLMSADNVRKCPVLAAIDKDRKDMSNKRRHDRERVRIAEYATWFETVRDVASQRPHPFKWAAEKGDTLADYWDWNYRNAGNAGRLRVGKEVQQWLKGKPD